MHSRCTIASLLCLILAGTLSGCSSEPVTTDPEPNTETSPAKAVNHADHPLEKHLTHVRQLTFGGENAEAYFSSDGTKLVLQIKSPPHECDQIFTMNLDGSDLQQVSSGKGRTTCAYFLYPENDRILYSSTHLAGEACPPTPSHADGYVWPIYSSYEIFTANLDGSDLQQLTESPGYDAEATLHPDGSRIVFTSSRDGDLEIYTMNPDGSDVTRLTHTPGYDGGPFFSPDGTKICYRSDHPEGEDLETAQELLSRGLVRPSTMDIWVMDADGSNQRQVTDLGRASFGPYFTPDSKRIVFASNFESSPREFDIYMVELDGSNLERVTYTESFDGFPIFSPDGKNFVWGSNRHGTTQGETNIFIADWVD